ncbi:ABC transporter substrate-binding protein [Amycolatopsis kentuckyensis]|uniref:ABC transporter substrate-binding protein n=1 Tax=Amycolatopsis kentuckyensis TaxID=218823 RepID=UPI001ABF0D95|nr:ABC transporter substrate-binding protein [Amycolatopsis kentuckyensis]
MTALSRPAVAVLAAVLLGGCAVSGAGTEGTAGPPVPGGTLNFAVETDTDCLDPQQSPVDVSSLLGRPLLDSLVALDSHGKVHPWLAGKWSISPDGLTYTFDLREDVTFSNGEPFDAAAVKANFDHVVAPRTRSRLAAASLGAYRDSTVLGPHRVAIRLAKPNSAFLTAVAAASLGMEAPATLTGDPKALCRKLIGTGPFVSAEGYVPQKGIEYTRRADYRWAPEFAAHQGPAYLDGIKVTVVPENAARLGALTSGQVDAITSVPPVDVARLRSAPGFGVQIAEAPGGNYNYFPNTAAGPFADVRVRRAFRAAIDWPTIVDKLYFGVFRQAKNPLSPATPGYDPTVESQFSYDPAAAARLLDEAGWTGRDAQGYRTRDGVRLTLVRPFQKAYVREQRDVLADQIQAGARAAGIEVRNVNHDYAGFFRLIASGTGYDLGDFSWQQASPDALRTLFDSANIPTPETGFGTNYARYHDRTVDDALAAALATVDPTRQAELYGQVQRRLTADAAVFPVYVYGNVVGLARKVQGLGFSPQSQPTFYDTWIAR